MTQIQKIIASCLGKANSHSGERVYITQSQNPDACSFTDKLCGAYGKIFIEKEPFAVPEGIFVDLRGVLRNDVQSTEIADFICKKLKDQFIVPCSAEFGGDSMTFLNMEDRFAVIKSLYSLKAPPTHAVFECDYITAEYTLEKFGKKPAAFFNDGPNSYLKVLPLDLSEI